jgi:hypothetical protein
VVAGFAATGPVVIGAVTEPPVDVLTVARRRRAAARSLRLRSIAARLARVATVAFATVVFEAAEATVEGAGDATFATAFVADATALDIGCVGADTVGTAT